MAGGGSYGKGGESEPWSGQQPYLRAAFDKALRLHENDPTLVGGTGGLNQEIFNNLSREYRRGGSPQEQALGSYISDALGGGGAGRNPFAAGLQRFSGGDNFTNRAMNRAAQLAESGSDAFSNNLMSRLSHSTGGDRFIDSNLQRLAGFSGGDRFVNQNLEDLSRAGGTNRYAAALGDPSRGAATNPFLDATYDRAAGRVTDHFSKSILPGINATFAGAGRTGGGLHGDYISQAVGEAGDALSGLATDIYGGAYESGQERLLRGQTAAGQLAGQDMDRRLRGLETAGRYAGDRLDRQLQATISAGGLAGDRADRRQRDVFKAADLGQQRLDRRQRGYQQILDAGGARLDRRLRAMQGGGALAGQDLDRNLGREQLGVGAVAGLEGLRDRNVAGLMPYVNQNWGSLQRFSDIVQANPLSQSGGGRNYGIGGK